MKTVAITGKRLTVQTGADTAVIPLTAVERALWQTGTPILDAGAVAQYKQRAKFGMLWRAIRWNVVGLLPLIAFMCLGRHWERAGVVSAAAVLQIALFAWLVFASELEWKISGYDAFESVSPIPAHVSAIADSLIACGVPRERLGVEHLKHDPILFVMDRLETGMFETECATELVPALDIAACRAGRRYDLVIW